MDTKQIENLVNILDASGLQVMEIELGDLRVYLSKSALIPSPVQQVQSVPAAAPAPVAPVAVQTRTQEAEKPSEPEANDIPEWDDLLTVTAPLVGTFHGLGSMGKEDVAVGDTLQAGERVCVVEAMKLMNDINMEQSGEITQVLCSEGDMVEFGQILFRYRPV